MQLLIDGAGPTLVLAHGAGAPMDARGMTALDYLEANLATHRNIVAEAPGLHGFIAFLCANGASYALYPNRSCADVPSVETIQRRILDR
jgi:hypothetical protein